VKGESILKLVKDIRGDIVGDPELLQKYNLTQDDFFMTWFLIQGRHEYSNMMDQVGVELVEEGNLSNFIPVLDENILTGLDLCIWILRGDLRDAFPLDHVASVYDFKLWRLSTINLEEILLTPQDLELFCPEGKSNNSHLDWIFSQGSGQFSKESLLDNINSHLLSQVELRKLIDSGERLGVLSDFIDTSKLEGYQNIVISELPEIDKGVNVLGYSHNELGIGEDARTVFSSCSLNEESFLFPLRLPGNPVFSQNFNHLKSSPSLPGRINIFTLPMVDFVQQSLVYGGSFLKGRYNIVFAPWEFNSWPESKSFCFNAADEIWTSSDYTTEAYLPFISKDKVQKMRLPVTVDEDCTGDRKRFGLPRGAFLFLYMFDFNSSLKRKNPEVLIKAFLAEFKDDLNCGLVLKFLNFSNDNPDFIKVKNLIDSANNIYCVNETLSSSEVFELIKSVNCYVSPHRAEGFGRTLAESMLLKVPVIATPYSGNCEFCLPETFIPLEYNLQKVEPGEYPLIDDSCNEVFWADVIQSDLQEKMKYVVSTDVKNMVNLAYKNIKENFSIEACSKIISTRLEFIRENLL